MIEELGEESNNVDTVEWLDIVRTVAAKGRLKLSKYYLRTGGEQGYLFNVATVLDLTQKLTAYEVQLLQLFITLYANKVRRMILGHPRTSICIGSSF
jgi:hypothetical protein